MRNASNIVVTIICAAMLWGCSTTRPGTNEAIIEHSRELAVLEERVRDYGATVDSVAHDIATVRDRASAAGKTIEATIILFDEYQRAVERLLRDYNRLRAQVTPKDEDNTMAIGNTGN